MLKFICIIFILGFFLSNEGYSGVNPSLTVTSSDLTDMLRNPKAAPKTSESFPTRITRPYAQNPKQDMRFFSDPKSSRGTWNREYQNYTNGANRSISAFEMFKTMGISRRAIMMNGNPDYVSIADAEMAGMIRILNGDLGLKDISLSEAEREVIARELLSVGRSIGNRALQAIKTFETAYLSSNLKRRRHFQTLALLMLAGHDRSSIDISQWYLKDVGDRDVLLSRVYGYADRFSPPKVGGDGGGGGSVGGVDVIASFATRLDALPDATKASLKRLILAAQAAVLAAQAAKWEESVDIILNEPSSQGALADAQLRTVVEAITRLSQYHKKEMPDSEKYYKGERADGYEYGVDTSILAKTYRKLFPPATARVKSPEVSIREYLMGSSLLNMFMGMEKDIRKKAFSEALITYVRNNGGTWPGYELLKVNEQFFWNLYMPQDSPDAEVEDYEKSVFETKISGSWEDFLRFCDPYLVAGQQPADKKLARRQLLKVYQAFPDPDERAQFITFSTPYLVSVLPVKKPFLMPQLLKVYQAFPDPARRGDFLKLCGVYLQRVAPDVVPECMAALLHVVQAFPDPARRGEFLRFCGFYLEKVAPDQRSECITALLPIYQAWPEQEERKEFFKFSERYTKKASPNLVPGCLNNLFHIYQAFPGSAARRDFLSFCALYLMGLAEHEKPSIMRELVPIYQAFPDTGERAAFLGFCDESLGGMFEWEKPFYMKTLLEIYRAFPESAEMDGFFTFCSQYFPSIRAKDQLLLKSLLTIYQNDREGFNTFVSLMKKVDEDVVVSYSPRDYLRYIRVNAALNAEPFPDENRIQAMYDTYTDQQLPILWVQDVYVPQARIIGGARANAHDFDAIYEQDREILFKWCQTEKYNPRLSTKTHDIYGTAGKIEGYQTNIEVEDFIIYLDTEIANGPPLRLDKINIEGAKVASIIKQMLGLESKKRGTAGGFAPYIGHSMYYARPEAPKGDEMLGRVWFFMKKMGATPNDVQDNKKSVILSILEASEISGNQVSTHCQTRMTGELMKLIAWKLPGSKLRPLIAAEDALPPVGVRGVGDINDRMEKAHRGARALFNRIKGDESVERALYDRAYSLAQAEPNLWQRYQTYYDILYGRTMNEDGNGYKRDENILMRDDRGNLVSLFESTGLPRARPVIVYYQAEFQVFEQAFTALLRSEFEEQRGLIY